MGNQPVSVSSPQENHPPSHHRVNFSNPKLNIFRYLGKTKDWEKEGEKIHKSLMKFTHSYKTSIHSIHSFTYNHISYLQTSFLFSLHHNQTWTYVQPRFSFLSFSWNWFLLFFCLFVVQSHNENLTSRWNTTFGCRFRLEEAEPI
jgi:hypothetical protein